MGASEGTLGCCLLLLGGKCFLMVIAAEEISVADELGFLEF